MGSVKGEVFELRVGVRDGMEVVVGEERYSLESSFSFPGDTIGFNYLPADKPGWKPTASWASLPNKRSAAASTTWRAPTTRARDTPWRCKAKSARCASHSVSFSAV